MPTRNINLTEHFDRFVEKQVSRGQFRNASEVMRAGLHLLEQRIREDDQKLALLRSRASKGFAQLDQGQGLAIDDGRRLANVIGQIGRHAAKRAKRNGTGG